MADALIMPEPARTAPLAASMGRHLRPAAPQARFSLRLAETSIATASAALGLELALPINRSATGAERSSLRLGPDEWLILAPVADAIGDALDHTLENTPYCLVDIGHRQTGLIVEGRHAAAMLNALCPLDLDAAQFPVGTATRTIFAKAEIVLWRTAPTAFHLEIWRSFAPYVAALLAEIGREYQD